MAAMSIEAKLSILARAILELADKAAYKWDLDGEDMVGCGVDLDLGAALREIAEEGET